ncbi:MAG: VWA domain-containing protein [Methylophilaceae bacterium]|nr:MAG: VWA domain-containing protein [Methylophilaceae bacterium]
MAFTNPLALWLLPLALLPILLERSHTKTYSWVAMLPHDSLSDLIGLLLKLLATVSIAFIILGIADPHTLEQKVEKIGIGAQIGLVLDRSASMDDPFSGGVAAGNVGETKSAAASRLMTEFVNARENDMIGIITFSNSAMYVLPLSGNRDAILSAIKATSGNALFQTNIGAGLTSAVSLFNDVPDSGSRAIILISDGAGKMDGVVQQKLKDWLQQYNITLYWIVLRQPGGISIFDPKYENWKEVELPPVQIELHNFFKTLNTPFQAYEADDPKSLETAIFDINKKEKKPITYLEKIPGKNFTQVCYLIAALMIALLLGVKYLENKTWRSA